MEFFSSTVLLSLLGILLALPVFSSQLSDNDREDVKILHDVARTGANLNPPALNMTIMYNATLEEVAREQAGKCFWNPDLEDNTLGQNVYATAEINVSKALVEAVNTWFNQRKYYDYETGKCSQQCDSYTQLVWADSRNVGCAVQRCQEVEGILHIRQITLVVCIYAPKGNIAGEKPYVAAPNSSSSEVQLATPIVQVDDSDLPSDVTPKTFIPCTFPGLSEVLQNLPAGKNLFLERLFIVNDGGERTLWKC